MKLLNSIKLEDIGFYTLSNERAINSSINSPLQRCELVLSSKCNFNCPYCRKTGGEDIEFEKAANIVRTWASDGLKNIRFSGGEPTLYYMISNLVYLSKSLGISRIALSTNGSAKKEKYEYLLKCGINDFSISLDACCSSECGKMTGHNPEIFDTIVENIKSLSARTYTTVGVVLTNDNLSNLNEIIQFANSLGVSDIRIIPAAQDGDKLPIPNLDEKFLEKYPILKYRINNLRNNIPIRGLGEKDSPRCGLVLDDIAICGDKHYPCIIYLREYGNPIGDVGPNMRQERLEWYKTHNTFNDPICKNNCLDVCTAYNNTFAETNLYA